jgi:hypothetical protein
MSGSDMTSVWNQDSDMESWLMSPVPQVGGRGNRSRQFASPKVPGQDRLNEAFASAVGDRVMLGVAGCSHQCYACIGLGH